MSSSAAANAYYGCTWNTVLSTSEEYRGFAQFEKHFWDMAHFEVALIGICAC